jgi:hypothetical protein
MWNPVLSKEFGAFPERTVIEAETSQMCQLQVREMCGKSVQIRRNSIVMTYGLLKALNFSLARDFGREIRERKKNKKVAKQVTREMTSIQDQE